MRGRASEVSDHFEVGGMGPPNAELLVLDRASKQRLWRRDPKWPAGSRRLVQKQLELRDALEMGEVEIVKELVQLMA